MSRGGGTGAEAYPGPQPEDPNKYPFEDHVLFTPFLFGAVNSYFTTGSTRISRAEITKVGQLYGFDYDTSAVVEFYARAEADHNLYVYEHFKKASKSGEVK